MTAPAAKQSIDDIKNYYGQVLASTADLKTSACCLSETLPSHIRAIVSEIHPEVNERFYGCGSPIPPELEGRTVLDLGSGSGRDCFVLSKLVGAKGKVWGIDMTDEQLAVARRHQNYHAEKFMHPRSNIEFVQGYIEDLKSCGIADHSVDVVVSNCVLNLSPDKERVFSEIFRVLKPGGELYFSDVFANRRIPRHLSDDPVLLGECLAGAMYIEDFRRMLGRIGCNDYRVISQSPISLRDPEIVHKIGMVDFYSMTIRAFHLDLEDRCEDFGQVAYYKGTIEHHPHSYALDDHHLLKTGLPMPVCSNTAAMLSQSRLASHFRIEGNTEIHYGLFDCGPGAGLVSVKPEGQGFSGACC